MTVIESNKKTQDRDFTLTPAQLADDDPWASLKAAIAHGFSDDFLANGREQPALTDGPQISDDDWPSEGELPDWLAR